MDVAAVRIVNVERKGCKSKPVQVEHKDVQGNMAGDITCSLAQRTKNYRGEQ
jgi:hypothetical protein